MKLVLYSVMHDEIVVFDNYSVQVEASPEMGVDLAIMHRDQTGFLFMADWIFIGDFN